MTISNGKSTFEHRLDYSATPAAPPIKLLSVAYIQFFTIALILLVLFLQIYVVIPGHRDIAEKARIIREEEIKHTKIIEDARRRQSVLEATLLVNQKENLRIVEEIGKLLREAKR